VAPLSVDALLAKMIDAAGGEAVLRGHTTAYKSHIGKLENQGLTLRTAVWSRYPNQQATFTDFLALGTKSVGRQRDWFDGIGGASVSDFAPAFRLGGDTLTDTALQSRMEPLLDARRVFPTMEITGTDTVDGQEVYILRKTPAWGNPIIDYVSTASFLVLRRDTVIGANAADSLSAPQQLTEIYRDYRAVDREMTPYTVVTRSSDLGEITATLTEIAFNRPVPPGTFSGAFPVTETTKDINLPAAK